MCRKFLGSSRSHRHAERAAKVNAWRRHRGGESVEPLDEHQDLRVAPARVPLGAHVEQLFGIALAPSVEGGAGERQSNTLWVPVDAKISCTISMHVRSHLAQLKIARQRPASSTISEAILPGEGACAAANLRVQ
jgi:hypothetical protein